MNLQDMPFPEVRLAQRTRDARGFQFYAPRMTDLEGVILFNVAEGAWAKALGEVGHADQWPKETAERIRWERLQESGVVKIRLFVDNCSIGLVYQDPDMTYRFHPDEVA